jgi:hypothetical protein
LGGHCHILAQAARYNAICRKRQRTQTI